MKINGKEIKLNELPTELQMSEHGIAYTAYAIALHLAKYDCNFKFDEIDTEWGERVYPLALEFYTSDNNDYSKPFMECLNDFLNSKPLYK